jgi:transposase
LTDVAKPLVSDELWQRLEPLLPVIERRYRYPGRRRHPDRLVFTGIMYVLKHGIAWEHLPQELGYGSGMTCWRRLEEWQQAGVWNRLHHLLLDELEAADRIDWSRVLVDGSHVRAKGGANRPGPHRSTGPVQAANIT